jgi:hypothetical protein
MSFSWHAYHKKFSDFQTADLYDAWLFQLKATITPPFIIVSSGFICKFHSLLYHPKKHVQESNCVPWPVNTLSEKLEICKMMFLLPNLRLILAVTCFD